MASTYTETMMKAENLYNSFVRKAEDLYLQNGKVHTKEECIFYQKALELCSHMASISVKEERVHQEERMQRLNMKINEIQKEISTLEDLKKLKQSGAQGGSQGGGDGSKNTESNTNGDSKNDPFADTVQGWFVEAPKHSFDDVAGMDDLKKKLKDCIFSSHLDPIRKYLKLKPIHSYFFIGPPGSGKTFIIKAFAHELMDQNYKFMMIEGSSILSKYVGDAEKLTTRFFDEVEKNAPCIAFVDEIDGICRSRDMPNLPNYAASITTAFLTGYNKINESDKQIVFIGATNYPDKVDNAMLDRVELVRFPLPDIPSRAAAFERMFSDVIALDDLTFNDMAEVTDDYNYRDIERLGTKLKNIIIEEALSASGNDENAAVESLKCKTFKLTRAMFDKAFADCRPTPKKEILRSLDEWENEYNSNKKEW